MFQICKQLWYKVIMLPRKIMIFGIPGSGKSTFSVQLGKRLHLPVFHLDKYFFTHGWKERDYTEFLAIQNDLVSKKGWVIDGNSTRSFEIRFSQADTALYFRFNRLVCLWRIFKRYLSKDPHISDRAEGCPETVSLRLIRYLWGFDKRVKSALTALRNRYPHVIFYELRNEKDLRLFLESIGESASKG